MKIGMLGSGNMAQAMGGYLIDRGYDVCGLWGRDHQKTSAAAYFINTTPYANLNDLVSHADVLMLAVSDDGIKSLSDALAESKVDLEGKWIGHFSGSLSLDTLDAVKLRGALCFSLHPLQTVPNPDTGRRDMGRATLVLEAGDGIQDNLEEWLEPCGNRTAWITPGKKGLYHLGACLASNYVMTLYRLAEEALIDSGISENIASDALFVLMESTLNNYRSQGALAGLTGPVSRGDSGTVRNHLDSLNVSGWEKRDVLIRALGLEALEIAREAGKIDADKALRMEHILKGGTHE